MSFFLVFYQTLLSQAIGVALVTDSPGDFLGGPASTIRPRHFTFDAPRSGIIPGMGPVRASADSVLSSSDSLLSSASPETSHGEEPGKGLSLVHVLSEDMKAAPQFCHRVLSDKSGLNTGVKAGLSGSFDHHKLHRSRAYSGGALIPSNSKMSTTEVVIEEGSDAGVSTSDKATSEVLNASAPDESMFSPSRSLVAGNSIAKAAAASFSRKKGVEPDTHSGKGMWAVSRKQMLENSKHMNKSAPKSLELSRAVPVKYNSLMKAKSTEGLFLFKKSMTCI